MKRTEINTAFYQYLALAEKQGRELQAKESTSLTEEQRDTQLREALIRMTAQFNYQLITMIEKNISD